MKRKLTTILLTALFALVANAQPGLKKVYNEDINPIEQINRAVEKAKAESKFVVCQVGGNWCPWCMKFADFITKDSAISKMIEDNFEYIHVSYNPRRSAANDQQQSRDKALMKRLKNAGRFGFPVLVVLDETGQVIHIQDSSFLEGTDAEDASNQAMGYNQKKVLRFFTRWTPNAVKQ